MATIKAIEGRSVHQIQSGQVIVDLCSVVKELVENSLDAGATSVEVRFKSQGLDAIEVQDNGSGIPKDDYESLALKHYTSMISTYGDLSSLSTFGFRGEALSSLCALATLTVATARDTEAPRGTKLEFETSGKLKGTSITACPKGTTVFVEKLFEKLPVRRRELEKSIKREYNKVIGILNAYACICTNTKFSVTNQVAKGKKAVVFATKGNPTTKENIANVYGAKTIPALIPLTLTLEMQAPAATPALLEVHGERALRSSKVEVHGHVSRPVHGEGRQTPDRQMFFVNSRPCGLPQMAKAFNEIYKSYNVTQSPFVFADFKMDTNAYDVNVSPDKRTIMLHDQQQLINTLKDTLVDLFEAQEQTVPLTQTPGGKLPAFKPPSLTHQTSSPSTQSTARSFGGSTSRGARSQDGVVNVAEPEVKTEESDVPIADVERDVRSEVERDAPCEVERPAPNCAFEDTRDRVIEVPHESPDGEDIEHVEPPAASRQPARPQDEEPSEIIEAVETTAGRPARGNGPGKSAETPFKVPRLLSNLSPEESASLFVQQEEEPHASAEDGPRKRRRLSPVQHVSRTRQPPSASRFARSLRGFAAPGTASANDQASEDEDEDVDSDDSEETGPGPYTQTAQETRNDPDWQQLAREHSSIQGSDDEVDEVDDEADGEVVHEADEGANGDERAKGEVSTADNEEDEYLPDSERKKREEARVQQLLDKAEQAAAVPTQANAKRAANALKRSGGETVNLIKVSATSASEIADRAAELRRLCSSSAETRSASDDESLPSGVTAEERLSLTISKSDFARMRIIGQFNLGFILAVRVPEDSAAATTTARSDDLFIIDQHASDEIYNFHRLSATTELTPQPLVHPHQLELTAIEEETVLEHMHDSLLKNGFRIRVDESGDSPVGRRCQLLTLPTSKETVFDTRDLEELLVLLQDSSSAATTSHDAAAPQPLQSMTATSRAVARPGKVRRMLAMRACRSSIMVGRALTRRGMAAVVRHMGEMERPWNCPHGRPTMRHVCGLGAWRAWREGDAAPWAHQVDEFEVEGEAAWDNGGATDWGAFLERMA